MSNLYKQWFVQTDSTNTRIIDSNVILQQHLKQDLPQTQTMCRKRKADFQPDL